MVEILVGGTMSGPNPSKEIYALPRNEEQKRLARAEMIRVVERWKPALATADERELERIMRDLISEWIPKGDRELEGMLWEAVQHWMPPDRKHWIVSS